MRGLLPVALFLYVIALLVCSCRATAQFWPPHDWWHASPSVIENPPTAHLFGGIGWNAFARGPWIARSFRNTAWKRLAVCGVGGGAWELYQVKEINAYPWKRAAWDWEATMVGCAATEGLLALIHR
jgi:hypothetical protein